MGKSRQIDQEMLQNVSNSSRFTAIVATFTCGAPVVWLFIYIYQENLQRILVAASCTIPVLIFITYLWCRHFYNKETDRLLLEMCDLEEKIAELNREIEELKMK